MTKQVKVGNILIGGGAPITVQSMTNTSTEDYDATYNQIAQLQANGCDIVRCTVPTEKAADNLCRAAKAFSVPLVADIHFDYKLAIRCAENGVAKVRINPSNIGSEAKVKELCAALKANRVPVRIGVNGGSLDKDIKAKYGVTAEALVESALRQARTLEKYGVDDIIISVKSSDCRICYDAYKLLSQNTAYPLHLGVTEAGFGSQALIKSSACIGGLLLEGIGDTVRVSITGNPVEEVKAAETLLRSLGLRKGGVELVSCPTCGRTCIDVEGIGKALCARLENVKKPLKIAVMGCIVNGIGEGKGADFGVAGGKTRSIIFSHGKQLMQVDNDKIIESLLKMAEEYDG